MLMIHWEVSRYALDLPPLPFAVQLNIGNVPQLANNSKAASLGKLDWSKLRKEDVADYALLTDNRLQEFVWPWGA